MKNTTQSLDEFIESPKAGYVRHALRCGFTVAVDRVENGTVFYEFGTAGKMENGKRSLDDWKECGKSFWRFVE